MQKLQLRLGTTERSIELADLKFSHHEQGQGHAASLLCPHCGNVGVFAGGSGAPILHNVMGPQGQVGVSMWLGVRHCPNTRCRAPVFLAEKSGEALITFPPRAKEFDASHLPERVKGSLAEAIQCHANACYRAAALLVRRTLEEVCLDREAQGKDLQKRIADLRDKITLPQALFEAMDSLRLLGNDAAHIEAKTYDNIGEQEVAVALMLTKEIVKAAYQYEDLLGQLKDLQTPAKSG